MAARQPVLEVHPDSFFQVAAVAYRERLGEPEFLLVRTGSGRWTFPKGNVERSLGARHSALREAMEEAGAHGKMAHFPFCAYLASKRGDSRQFFVYAYLLRVTRQHEPPELERDPQWFDAETARRMLRLSRSEMEAAQIANVIDLAVAVIRDVAPAMAMPRPGVATRGRIAAN